MKRTYTYKAKLLRVIDGDTLSLDIDCGFRIRREIRVRLEDINAPELKSGGAASKQAVIDWLGEEELLVTTYIDPGSYDRYTAMVWKSGSSENLNDYLVKNGFAEYKKYD